MSRSPHQHAFHLGDDDGGAYGPILGSEGRSSSSSISSNNLEQPTDGVFAVANSGPEGQAASSSSSTAASDSLAAASASGVTLNLKTLTGQVMSIQLPSFDGLSVLQLKQAFESAHGIPAQLQRWIWSGREVNDSMSAAECRLESGSTVHLLLRQNPVGPVAAPVAMPVGGAAPYGGAYQNAFPVDAAALEGGAAQAHVNVSADRMVDIQRAFQLARALRIFAMIDAIILLVWALSFPPYAVGVVLCLFGYYGATNVRIPYVAVYLVYLVLAIALRIYLVAIAPDLLSRVLFVMLAIISVYIMRLTIQFIKYLKSFTEQERAELAWMIRPYTRPMPGYA